MNADTSTIAWTFSADQLVEPRSVAVTHRLGSWGPLAQAAFSMHDVGLRQSVIAVERLRTYGGRIWQLEEHLVRWRRTIDFLGIDITVSNQEVETRLQELLERNQAWCQTQGDVGVTMLATPGQRVNDGDQERWVATEIMHLNPLPLQQIQRHRQDGQAMLITNVQQPPPEAWPRDIKVRCRLHYYLADRQAAQFAPGSVGVLLDSDGSVTEASVANLAIVAAGRIISPPPGQVLPGITQHWLQTLADRLQIDWIHQRLFPADLRRADEILLMGTDGGIWFANQIDGQSVGSGAAGPIYRRLCEHSVWRFNFGGR